MEREDAAGHRGQEEREAETEGESSVLQAQGPSCAYLTFLSMQRLVASVGQGIIDEQL